jgi:hypothetical protein
MYKDNLAAVYVAIGITMIVYLLHAVEVSSTKCETITASAFGIAIGRE